MFIIVYYFLIFGSKIIKIITYNSMVRWMKITLYNNILEDVSMPSFTKMLIENLFWVITLKSSTNFRDSKNVVPFYVWSCQFNIVNTTKPSKDKIFQIFTLASTMRLQGNYNFGSKREKRELTVWMEHSRNKAHCRWFIRIILCELKCQLKRTWKTHKSYQMCARCT